MLCYNGAMKKLRIIFALAATSALLGSCSILDTFFHDPDDTYEDSSSQSSGSSSSSSETPSGIQSISLDQHNLSLAGGESHTFTVTFDPADIVNKRLDWVSSNPSVASISNTGTTIALSMGTADITVYYRTNHAIYDVCHVTVTSSYQCNEKTELSQSYTDIAANSIYGAGGNICPVTGSPKLLIIPVWFTNSDTYITSTENKNKVRSDIETVYLGTEAQTGWHSVKSYYATESKGLLNLNGTVSDWYEAPNSSSYYANDDDYCSITKNLVRNAASWYFDNHTDNKADYDTNSDGQYDGVMLIYGAPDYRAAGSSTNNLWAYKYATGSTGTVSNPAANVFFWASYDFMYGSNKASSRAGSNYYGGDTSHCTLDGHTFIHEMGHVLGLDDYYDYGDTDYCVAGGFSMQDYNVGGHDPYSVMAYGWADPYIPIKSCQMTINAFQDSHDMILLSSGFNSYGSPFDEYLLLELYTPTGLNKFDTDYVYSGGYPQGPSQPGIRLWHVDARLYSYYSGSYTSNANAGYVDHMNNNSCSGDRLSGYNDGHGEVWDLLRLIRRSTTADLTTQAPLSYSDLFTAGSSFTFNTFRSQFAQDTFNNGAACKWSFTVESVSNTSATISIVLSN